MKTLAQVEPKIPITNIPYAISNPGAYYVTTNLTTSSSSGGIIIMANDVTIDLMGFTLDGAGTGQNGMDQGNSYRNLTLVNGTLRNWSWYGVGADGAFNRIENVSAFGNRYGMYVGTGSIVRGCTAACNNNTSYGINVLSTLSRTTWSSAIRPQGTRTTTMSTPRRTSSGPRPLR